MPLILFPTGVYNMEAITDFNWNILSYAILMIYHFVVLQILSVVSFYLCIFLLILMFSIKKKYLLLANCSKFESHVVPSN